MCCQKPDAAFVGSRLDCRFSAERQLSNSGVNRTITETIKEQPHCHLVPTKPTSSYACSSMCSGTPPPPSLPGTKVIGGIGPETAVSPRLTRLPQQSPPHFTVAIITAPKKNIKEVQEISSFSRRVCVSLFVPAALHQPAPPCCWFFWAWGSSSPKRRLQSGMWRHVGLELQSLSAKHSQIYSSWWERGRL